MLALVWTMPRILILPTSLAYFTLLEAAAGRTPGKLLLGLRVVRALDGGRIGVSQSLLRNLVRPLWATPLALVDAWSLGATELDQRLGDLAAGTIVLDDRLIVSEGEQARS